MLTAVAAVLFGFVLPGVLGFAVSAFGLFALAGYFVLRLTGYMAGSAEADSSARRLAALFGKIFAASIVWLVLWSIVVAILRSHEIIKVHAAS